MNKFKRVVHFNVDRNLKKILQGEHYPFDFHHKSIEKIPHKNQIQVVSINSLSLVNDTSLSHFPSLRLLITRSVGIDHIDLEICKKKGIAAYYIPDYGSHNIAEHALGLLLACARNLPKANKYINNRKFYFSDLLGVGLKRKTLGVIGAGKIGLAFIKLVSGLDFKILAYDVKKDQKAAKKNRFNYVSLDKLLEESDFISLHIPLHKATFHLIGEKEIKKMKKGVILINTARGGVINTQALLKNIERFKAVGLDVIEDEASFTNKHPLLKHDHVIITPHIAFYTDDAIKRIAKETENCIDKFVIGNKEGRVI